MRHLTNALISLFLAGLCLAQGSTGGNIPSSSTPSTTSSSAPSSASRPASSSSSTSKAPAVTHTIDVGNGDHKFRPDVVQAQVGDTIEFRYFPANHSVVRAEYGYPCIPYEMTGKGKTGFYSGFHPVDAFLDDPPKWSIKINNSDPIFFYCSAPGSCTDWGMVGVINPNSTTSLAAQRDLALHAAYSLNPGDTFPAESSQLPINPLTSGALPTSPTSSKSSKNGLPAGAFAGIVIGSIVVVALAAVLFFYIGRSRTMKQELARKSSTIRRVTPPEPMHYAHDYNNGNPANIPPIYSAGGGGVQQHTPHHLTDKNTGTWGGSPTSAGSMPYRAGSHRSVGGTFDLNQSTRNYNYTSPTAMSPNNANAAHWEKPGSPVGVRDFGREGHGPVEMDGTEVHPSGEGRFF